MGLFKKSKIAPYSEHHLKRAEALVNSANIYAVGTYVHMLDKFPELEAIEDSNLLDLLDYLITIASVGAAFAEIADSITDKDQRGLTHAIKKKLNDWESDSYKAMKNFLMYAHQLMDSGVEIPDAIGGWIWVNLEKHPSANQNLKELASSLKLVRPVGLHIMTTFHNWWNEN